MWKESNTLEMAWAVCPSPDTCPCPQHTLKTFIARCRGVKELGQAYPSPNTGICHMPVTFLSVICKVGLLDPARGPAQPSE